MQILYVVNDKYKNRFLEELINKKEPSLVMGFKEFLKQWDFNYDENTLLYICRKYHVTREIALKYINNLYFIKDNVYKRKRNKFLKELKDDLINNKVIEKNLLFREWLKNFKVIFYHLRTSEYIMDELLEQLSLITSVEVKNIERINHSLKGYKAKDLKEEVFFVCLQIRKLIDKGIDVNNIYVTNLNDDYRINLEFLGNLLGLNWQFNKNRKIYSTRIIQEFKKRFTEDWTTVLENLKELVKTEEEQDIYNCLIDFCNQFVSLDKDDAFYKYGLEYLEELTISEKRINNSIKEFDFLEEEVPKDSYVFVLGVNQGEFPKIKKNLYFDNLDCKELKIRLNYELAEKNNEECLARVMDYKNIVVCWKHFYMGVEYYQSSLLENVSLELEEMPDDIYKYSNILNKLIYGREMDTYYKYGIVSEKLKKLINTYSDCGYGSYDNQFQRFENLEIRKELSFSTLDVYQHCPFRYYLSYILKLQDNSLKIKRSIGTIFHVILQNYYQDNFNLEQIFTAEVLKLGTLNKKEQFFMTIFYQKIQDFLKFLKMQEQFSDLKDVKCEEQIEIALSNGFIFKGIIDKLYYNNENVVVIDYKTGSLSFSLDNLPVGLDMQLPIYLLLLEYSEYKDKEIIGFYLQHVLSPIIVSDYKHTEEQLINKHYMLNGYSTNMESLLEVFDKSYKDSKIIKGLKISSKGFYSYSKVLNDKAMEEIRNLTKNVINETIKKMENKEFLIRPKRVNMILKGCEFCDYKELCYKKEEDIVDYKTEKLAFLGGCDNGLDE